MLIASSKQATITLLSTLMPTLVIGQTISLPPPQVVGQTLKSGAATTQTVNPSIMLEKSQSYALDNYVRAFRVPTTNSTGTIRYYDVTIKLMVNPNGTLNPVATVSASLSPDITTGVIVPGAYKAPDGSTPCNVTNMTLTNGRIQSFFTCNADNPYFFELSVVTGPVTAGHPYVNELVAAGINWRTDVGTYTWGIITNHALYSGCGWLPTGDPVGAKTDGNRLILSFFNTQGAFQCNQTFIK